jgi:hypothetical protein
MTAILGKRSKQLKFTDDFCSEIDSPFYDVTVNVTEKLYENGNKYFDIDYEYKFNQSPNPSNNKVARINAHPFKDNLDNADGVIVIKNDLTSKMVDFLLMDDEELDKLTGFTTDQRYRINIMHSLALFWD